MNKFIYAISNVYNGKIYIGQTKNTERRWREHKRLLRKGEHYSKLMQEDWDIYGEDGFEFIVFGDFENYNEIEKEFIKKYNSIKNGYNTLEGGENIPPIHKGEESSSCLYSEEIIDEIIYCLKYTDLSFGRISKMYNCNQSTIGRINIGKIRRRDNIEYPIREESRLYEEIIYNLKNTKLTQKEISYNLGVARSTVTMINIGKNHRQPNEDYPIRKKPMRGKYKIN